MLLKVIELKKYPNHKNKSKSSIKKHFLFAYRQGYAHITVHQKERLLFNLNVNSTYLSLFDAHKRFPKRPLAYCNIATCP